MPGALKVLATKCALWVISGHERTDQEMSALPSKADMFSVEIYVPRCHQRTTYWAALEQRDTVLLATLCKRSAPHQEVESSAVTALSQQEVSHGYHPQTRSKVASPNPEGRPISRSSHVCKDAEAWARQMEVQADRRELPSDPHGTSTGDPWQLVECSATR